MCCGVIRAVNKADKDRLSNMKESGCICCLLVTGKTQAPDIHHLTSGMRRKGHQYTISACPWHHRGLVPDNHTKQSISGLLGPSYAHGRRGFQEFFGSDDLLLEIQNIILRHFAEQPWIDYMVPSIVTTEARHLWDKK